MSEINNHIRRCLANATDTHLWDEWPLLVVLLLDPLESKHHKHDLKTTTTVDSQLNHPFPDHYLYLVKGSVVLNAQDAVGARLTRTKHRMSTERQCKGCAWNR